MIKRTESTLIVHGYLSVTCHDGHCTHTFCFPQLDDHQSNVNMPLLTNTLNDLDEVDQDNVFQKSSFEAVLDCPGYGVHCRPIKPNVLTWSIISPDYDLSLKGCQVYCRRESLSAFYWRQKSRDILHVVRFSGYCFFHTCLWRAFCLSTCILLETGDIWWSRKVKVSLASVPKTDKRSLFSAEDTGCIIDIGSIGFHQIEKWGIYRG